MHTNAAMSINKTGVYLWNRIKDGASEAEMVSDLVNRYSDVTQEQAATDVNVFLQELRNRSLLSED